MDNPSGKRRGRRPKHPVERLRGLLTLRVLMARLGVNTVYGLTRALFPEYPSKSPEIASAERSWRRYVNGSVVPSTDFLDLISPEIVAAVKPHCIRCLRSMVWTVLQGEAVEEWDLWRALNGLPPHIRAILFEAEERIPGTGLRLREFDGHVADAVAALTGFEAIETFVLLAAYARALSSEAMRNAVSLTYMQSRITLSEDPELTEHFRELFTVVDKFMKLRMFSTSTMKIDVLAPWQGQMPEKAVQDPNRPSSLTEMARLGVRYTTKIT